jgi:chaperonin cofactor prefoldin
MDQYKHQDEDYKVEQVKDTITPAQLEEQLNKLTAMVAHLTKKVEFLERQDQRSRSSFEQIQSRIAARK